MLGGRRWASSRRALTSRSRGGPDANTMCHGWMSEFDGACWARTRASSTNARGTGRGKNSRVEWRSRITCSRSNIVTPPTERMHASHTPGSRHGKSRHPGHPHPHRAADRCRIDRQGRQGTRKWNRATRGRRKGRGDSCSILFAFIDRRAVRCTGRGSGRRPDGGHSRPAGGPAVCRDGRSIAGRRRRHDSTIGSPAGSGRPRGGR